MAEQEPEGRGGAPSLDAALAAVVRRRIAGATGISDLRRLSGGASQETFSFDVTTAGAPRGGILRRRPGGDGDAVPPSVALRLETEAELVRRASTAGVPVATVWFVLEPTDGLGSGYVMERLEGETIARRILRDDAFAAARPRLARQCGEILARIHALAPSSLPELPLADAKAQLAHYRSVFDSYDHPHPVFELAFRWLGDQLPPPAPPVFVHGDFRNGNLLIAPDGVRGVLDWEIAHLGDPMEDLGWICVNSWRFGAEPPVGGFGAREDLYAGYEAAGGCTVDRARARFWEVMGTLKWGIMCMMMYGVFERGVDRSVERAAIGRRSSETEIDLLALLLP